MLAMTCVQFNVWNASAVSLWGQASDPTLSVEAVPGMAPVRLRARNNPCFGPVRLELEHANAGPIEITLFDVSGRRLHEWKVTGATQGPLVLEWDPLRTMTPLRSGIVFARATSSSGTFMTKFVLLR